MRSRSTLLATAAATLLALGSAGDARADVGSGAGAAVLIVVGLTDLGMVTYDTALAAKVERPSKVYGIVEGAIGAPQAVLAYGGAVLLTQQSGAETALQYVAPLLAIPSFMGVHGIWGASSPHVDPGALYGVSWATGADAVFTAGDLGGLFAGRSLQRGYGIVELVATAPQLAVASYELGANASERAGWIALDAWAGLLFVHGVASVIWGDKPYDALARPADAPAEPPPPKTPSPGDPPTPSGPLVPEPTHGTRSSAPSAREAALRWDVGPLAVRGGSGVVVRGAW